MTRQSDRTEMIRTHRESFYVMKQRNVTARKLAKRIMKDSATQEDAQKLQRLLARGARLEWDEKAMQTLRARLSSLQAAENTKEG